MRPVDFPEVKRLVGMEMVLELIGWEPRRIKGEVQRGPCPVHGSRNPGSRIFVVGLDVWYCHYCKRGGSQLDLYALVHGLPLLEAAVRLCQQAGVDVPYLPRRPRRPRTRPPQQRRAP
jgi:hypothetical protein